MSKGARPIYEWVWRRPDAFVPIERTTRSARRAGVYRRFAARFGGTVERRQVGLRISLAELFR